MRLVYVLLVLLAGFLAGCDVQSEKEAPKKTVQEEFQDLLSAAIVHIEPEAVSDVFALGSDSTDLQRDLLYRKLMGGVIEWSLRIYEISLADGTYKITTQPISGASSNAGLIVVILLHPRHQADKQFLETAKTGTAIRIRGRVREILLRSAILIQPGMLVHPTMSNPET